MSGVCLGGASKAYHDHQRPMRAAGTHTPDRVHVEFCIIDSSFANKQSLSRPRRCDAHMHIAANMMMKALQTGTMDLRQSVVKAILQDESERGVEGWREGRSGWWDEGTRGGGAEEGRGRE